MKDEASGAQTKGIFDHWQVEQVQIEKQESAEIVFLGVKPINWFSGFIRLLKVIFQ